MTDFEKAYSQLNPAQKRAVDQIEGPVLVLAGPGTGKTQVLTVRIGKILTETQVNPQNILSLTFTEAAAAEMKNRLVELIGRAGYDLRIQTFHSFCNDVILENPEKFLSVADRQPLDDLERVAIVKEILDELPPTSPLKPFADPYLYTRDIISNYSDLKREGISVAQYRKVVTETEAFIQTSKDEFEMFLAIPWQKRLRQDALTLKEGLKNLPGGAARDYAVKIVDRFLTSSGFSGRGNPLTALKDLVKRLYEGTVERLPKQKELAFAYDLYEKKLASRWRYDYEDMILFVRDRFLADDNLLAKYQEQYQYILVDEFQDTNGSQNEIVRSLGSFFPNPNVFVVGDDDQSIFRFQGASLENILSFKKTYGKDAKVIVLTENYRSPQILLDAAGRLIEFNQERATNYISGVTKNLTARVSSPGDKIAVCILETRQSENYFVSAKVTELIRTGIAPKEIAVLFRNNSDCLDLGDLFLRQNIPFKLEAGKNILEDILIKQVLSLLTFVADFDREDQLFFALNSDFLGLDAGQVMCLTRFAWNNRRRLWTVISDPGEIESAGVTDSGKFLGLSQKLLAWRKASFNQTLEEVFDRIIKESGLLAFVLAHPKKVDYLNKLNTLFSKIKDLNRKDHRLTLKSFLEQTDLYYRNNLAITEHRLETEKNAVHLLTAHKAKGREFGYVFIIQALDKHWGNVRQSNRLPLPLGLLENDPVSLDPNEDERRLFYVCLTRAKQKVYITYARNLDQGKNAVPTIFLSETPEQYLDFIDTAAIEQETLKRLQTVFLEPSISVHLTKEKEWLEKILSDYQLSVTDLSNYLECPRLFFYKNLIKVPAVKTPSESLGTAVHLALRNWSLALAEAREYSREKFLADFTKYLEREVMDQTNFGRSLAVGREFLANYYDHYRETFSASNLVEYNFSSHGVRVGDIPITGMVDKVEILDHQTKKIRVVDYKTGNPDNRGPQLKEGGEYHRQIVFYKLLCHHSPRFGFRFTEGEINFVQKSKKTNGFIRRIYEVNSRETEELIILINKVYNEIKSMQFLEFSRDRFCGECEFCQLLGVVL